MNLLYVLNDNLLIADRLRDIASFADTGLYENTATVQVTVVDSDGNELSGQSWPLALPYVAGSDGKYQVTLEEDLPIADGEKYVGEVDAEVTPDIKAHWKAELKVVERWV